jgi:S1-C subfamily serine protease
MIRPYKLLYMLLVIMVICPGCSSLQTTEHRSALYDKLFRASVEVLAEGKMAGSGAFVSADGYVLTAGHYITSPDMELEVLSVTAGRKPARCIAVDKGHDLALLKIDTQKKLPFLQVSSKDPQPGQPIYVVGSPLNHHSLMLQGVVASRHPDYDYLTDQALYVKIWYVAAMSPRGISGGNWVNSQGRIIGVQSGFINDQVAGTEGNTNSGIAFVAGPQAVKRLIEIKKHAETTSIGGIIEELWTQAPGFQQRFEKGTEGLVIHQLRPGGPLEKAQLAHEDLILAVDGKKMRYRRELMEIIRNKKPGDKLMIDYVKPDNKGAYTRQVVLDCIEQNWLKENALTD